MAKGFQVGSGATRKGSLLSTQIESSKQVHFDSTKAGKGRTQEGDTGGGNAC